MNRTDKIEIVSSIPDLRESISAAKRSGKVVGVIPTMGALHDGHVSLAAKAETECDFTVATIFVNPTQFAPGEDLEKYPRKLEADAQRLAEVGVDVVFAPATEDIYPQGYSTSVQPPKIATKLEGEFRLTHFEGVCTVVLKLFNLVQPDRAYFGQKDFQQLAVVRKMVEDLNLPVEVVGCPIVRAPDGLALSSRNIYLSESDRDVALSLTQCLKFVEREVRDERNDPHELMAEMRQRLIDAGVDSIDYAVIANPKTLDVPDTVSLPVVVLLAVHVGGTRLIDNCLIE